MAMDPTNNELQDTANKTWDEAAITEWKEHHQNRYNDLNTKYNGLDILIGLDGKTIGYGDIYEFESGVASVGIVLNKEARGKGVGKDGMRVLTQMGFELGMKISSGTMKANEPMRGVMRSLGVDEVEKVVSLPGRGLVAELDYTVGRDKWKDVDMKVEFGGSLTSRVEMGAYRFHGVVFCSIECPAFGKR
jgi:RimJ/RimL family protein N-acetyltransferase